MLNIYVIGCGGGGGYLCDKLPMAIASLSLDMLERVGEDITQYLEDAGKVHIPCIADRLVLVDADTFNPRNSLRQGAGSGSKLDRRLTDVLDAISDSGANRADIAQRLLEDILDNRDSYDEQDLRDVLVVLRCESMDKVKAINATMLRGTYLQRMEVIGYNAYVAPGNIGKIIPKVLKPNDANLEARGCYKAVPKDFPIVFLCVDNKKSRYEIHKYMETFDDCLIINAGNTKETGQVTIYERKAGIALDPPLYEIYPDIADGTDKRPDELGCEYVAPSHDQIAITNSVCADFTLAMMVKWVKGGLYNEGRRGTRTRVNELSIDTDTMSVIPLSHTT